MSNAARLREFHRAIGLQPPERPTVPPADLLALRRTLIAEEWAEAQTELDRLAAHLKQTEGDQPTTMQRTIGPTSSKYGCSRPCRPRFACTTARPV